MDLLGLNKKEREEKRFEKHPKRELKREARHEENVAANFEDFKQSILHFRQTTVQNFNTLEAGWRSVDQLYELLTRYLASARVGRKDKSWPNVNSELHARLQKQHGTEYRYIIDEHKLSVLKNSVANITEPQEEAIEAILETWKNHPMMNDSRALRKIKTKLAGLASLWRHVREDVRAVPNPYILASSDHIIQFFQKLTVIENRRASFEAKNQFLARNYATAISRMRDLTVKLMVEWIQEREEDVKAAVNQ